MHLYPGILFLLIIIGESSKGEKIIGGTLAEEDTFKYQVSVQKDKKHKCGGGIIGDKYILTAAHCLIDIETGKFMASQFTVVASILDLTYTHDYVFVDKVKKVYVPKIFNRVTSNSSQQYRSDGDLAVLKLQYGFKLVSNSKLNKLLLAVHNSYFHRALLVSGYGYSRVFLTIDSLTRKVHEAGFYEGRLRYCTVQILPDELCIQHFIHFNPVNHICAKATQKSRRDPTGTCTGDSGGPLVYNENILVGLLCANTLGCVEKYKPAIYVKISSYTSFIDNVLQGKRTSDMRIATWKKESLFNSKFQFVEN